MDSKTLREKFLKFFEKNGHKILPSASLVPENDPSVLFTTAGMQQFKRFYLFPDEAPAAKVATSQKCLRTGDIDEVGDDTHLSFFEMLGNFSFGYPEKDGSYFKEKAIELAWEFLTSELNIDKARIHATYFESEKDIPTDEESKKILESIEDLKEIKPQGFDDNFWSLGTENSPGGPTVEFYVDNIEIWNLVFNEYVYHNGKYEPSELKGVDTGMGFERLLCVINNAENVFHTDLFDLPHKKLHELLIKEEPIAERIILDHIKAAIFAINDGVLPSNKDAGYIVRRLIRRAIVKAKQLGIEKEFIKDIAAEVFKTYDGVYKFNEEMIISELEKEEDKFRKNLESALRELEFYSNFEKGDIKPEKTQSKVPITGEILFDLYQSKGLPVEIALEEAKRLNLNIKDDAEKVFNIYIKSHQDLSRTASAGMFKGGLQSGGEMETKYHTATHLLHAALRKVLGEHVSQKGSNINTERLRFDFSHPDKMTDEQIKEVENIVNDAIIKDFPVTMEEMSPEQAKASGALGFFEHKYGDVVKVYTIDDISREICGGPHIKTTGELGHFKIVKEESSSSGIRRIKAILE